MIDWSMRYSIAILVEKWCNINMISWGIILSYEFALLDGQLIRLYDIPHLHTSRSFIEIIN
jgi:hypothetical protein